MRGLGGIDFGLYFGFTCFFIAVTVFEGAESGAAVLATVRAAQPSLQVEEGTEKADGGTAVEDVESDHVADNIVVFPGEFGVDVGKREQAVEPSGRDEAESGAGGAGTEHVFGIIGVDEESKLRGADLGGQGARNKGAFEGETFCGGEFTAFEVCFIDDFAPDTLEGVGHIESDGLVLEYGAIGTEADGADNAVGGGLSE